jgi:hypothetical protein
LAQNRNAMQDDKTLFTEKISAGKRTYFLDVKETPEGSQLFKMTESRKNDGQFMRHSVLIFQEDFDKIFEALDKVREYIRKNPSSKPNWTPPVNETSSYETKRGEKEEDLSF